MKSNTNKSITDITNNKIALYNITCKAACGYTDGNDVYLDDIISISDFVTDYFTRDYNKILSEFFDQIIDDLNLKERAKVIVNEKEQELFAMTSDGSLVLLYDFVCCIAATGYIGECLSPDRKNDESVA